MAGDPQQRRRRRVRRGRPACPGDYFRGSYLLIKDRSGDDLRYNLCTLLPVLRRYKMEPVEFINYLGLGAGAGKRKTSAPQTMLVKIKLVVKLRLKKKSKPVL